MDLVTVRSVVSSRLEAGGAWALEFPGVVHLKFAAVEAGSVWIQAGNEEAGLEAGDCFVLATSGPYVVASNRHVKPVDGLPAFRASVDNVARIGSADEVAMSGGRFVLDESAARLLLDVLPPLLVVRSDGPDARSLRVALELFFRETTGSRPGSALAAAYLGRVVFVGALRAALDAQDDQLRGWLAALADARIGRALQLMHEEPARRWTVPELAAAVHASRSTFAARFRELVGTSPLDYLLRLRMHLARRALRQTSKSVSTIGASLGYGSDAAFSNAFKRVTGFSPTSWRGNQHDTIETADETDAALTRPPTVEAAGDVRPPLHT